MIEDRFNSAVDYLHENVTYYFSTHNCLKWHTATWSKKVQPNYINKHGTEADKLGNFHGGTCVPKRSTSEGRCTRNRQRKEILLVPRRTATKTPRSRTDDTKEVRQPVASMNIQGKEKDSSDDTTVTEKETDGVSTLIWLYNFICC